MEKIFHLASDHEAATLYGLHDEHLKLIEAEFGVKTGARGRELTVTGPETAVQKVNLLVEQLLSIVRSGQYLRRHDVVYAIRAVGQDSSVELNPIYADRIEVFSKKQFVTPRTAGQKAYVDAIRRHDIVFAVGVSGTGKTFLAMAMAVNALKRQEISRIILTRPAVEAGERLGYLPGDILAKVDPYLRPLYDALYDMLDPERLAGYMERGTIEVAPLAFMRGRTLNDSFIVLDEAQNTTPEQMQMFLTRLGFGSKAVVTGDVTQIDLPLGRTSGLVQAMEVVGKIEGISFVYFDERDVVRHKLVQAIVKAYDAYGSGPSTR